MKRIEIEEYFVGRLESLIDGSNFLLQTRELTGRVHIVEYQSRSKEVVYTLKILFHEKGDLWYEARLYINYPIISNQVKKIDSIYYKYKTGCTFITNLYNYIYPPNRSGIFHETNFDYAEFIDAKNKDSLELAIDNFYKKYFLVVVENIIPITNDVDKSDKLINEIIDFKNYDIKIPMSILSASIPSQLIHGLIIAKTRNRCDYDLLKERYLFEYKDYLQDENEHIDMLRKTALHFK